jgi:hypothetical protein
MQGLAAMVLMITAMESGIMTLRTGLPVYLEELLIIQKAKKAAI